MPRRSAKSYRYPASSLDRAGIKVNRHPRNAQGEPKAKAVQNATTGRNVFPVVRNYFFDETTIPGIKGTTIDHKLSTNKVIYKNNMSQPAFRRRSQERARIRRSLSCTLMVLSVVGIGCKKGGVASEGRGMSLSASSYEDRAPQTYAMSGSGGPGMDALLGQPSLPPPSVLSAPHRFIAERHNIEVIAAESDLQKLWESVVTFCGTAQCEIISSSFATRTGYSAPAGTIFLRIAPQDASNLFNQVQKLGKIAHHTTER